jgi:hypothetical protein
MELPSRRKETLNSSLRSFGGGMINESGAVVRTNIGDENKCPETMCTNAILSTTG